MSAHDVQTNKNRTAYEHPVRPGSHTAWSFVLSPADAQRTRLSARTRVACGGDALRWCSVWLPPFTDMMESEQLRSVARAAEGQLPTWYASLREAAGSALRAIGGSRRAG